MKKRAIWLLMALLIGTTIGCKRKQTVEQPVDIWYKHMLLYNLDVKTFKDSDGDGEGDFKGLTSKLDYLKQLGINAIWLAPFQPSPLEDDGYDITNYKAIDPKLGTPADFTAFMKQAKAKHIKVIMDIVLNHTSIDHPWFTQRRDWYVWSKKRPSDWDKGEGFPVVEKETWRLDSTYHQYYFHRFYHFEPDLNFQNGAVVNEAKSIMSFWLNQGLDGFRLDAVPFIIDDPRKDTERPIFDFNILHELTGFVRKNYPHVVLVGEANIEPEENEKYFAGHHDGLQMMFNFYANQYLFYGLATGDASLFKKALEKTKFKPGVAQWGWFLRNHDEIDLGRLSKGQLKKVYEKMGPDTNMQLYKRGIRRRLAPMLNDDPDQLRMAYSLLYSLPGVPIIRQGEELGMGDDLRLKERLAIRTPMQWDTTANGGFTTGKPFRPVISTPVYGYKVVNASSEQNDRKSLLNFIEQTMRRRLQYPEIANGTCQILKTSDSVLAMLYTAKGKQVLIVHNFSRQPGHVKVMGQDMALPGYGFDWRRLNE